jgi:CheY-like chemotaxis protein
MKLVVIDDEQENLDRISAASEQFELEVHTANDPKRAMDLVHHLRPKIVLLDLVRPGVRRSRRFSSASAWSSVSQVRWVPINPAGSNGRCKTI